MKPTSAKPRHRSLAVSLCHLRKRLTDHEVPWTGRPHLSERDVRCGASGDYPWDHWERVARFEGMDEAAAALGRAVIRAAWVYDWPEPLRGRCGWRDNGRAMRRWALARPRAAAARWLAYLQAEPPSPETHRR